MDRCADIPYIGSITWRSRPQESLEASYLLFYLVLACFYAIMLCFVTLKVRESCKAARAPPQTPLAVVGVSRHAITFPPHLNPRSAPDLAKRKGTPSYPCIRCQTQGEVVGFANSMGTPPPPPPQYSDLAKLEGDPSLRHCLVVLWQRANIMFNSGVGREYKVQRPTAVVPHLPGEGAGGGHPSRPARGGWGSAGSYPIGVWGGAPEANAVCVEKLQKLSVQKLYPVRLETGCSGAPVNRLTDG